MFRSLDKACQNFAVASDLHALVLVTPLDGVEPNWGRFREEYLACGKDDPVRVVGDLVRLDRNSCRAVFFWGLGSRGGALSLNGVGVCLKIFTRRMSVRF